MEVTFEVEGLRARVEMDLEQLREVLRGSSPTTSAPLDIGGGAEVVSGAPTTSAPIDIGGGADVGSAPATPPGTSAPPATPIGGGSQSVAAQAREVARAILADGHGHARREISAAVREAGLKTSNLDGALAIEFERYVTAEGDPAYRDPAAPPPDRRRSVPDWLERATTEPPSRDKIEVLSVNGGPPDG